MDESALKKCGVKFLENKNFECGLSYQSFIFAFRRFKIIEFEETEEF